MKKIILLLLILVLNSSFVFAFDEDIKEFNDAEILFEENFEKPILLEPSDVSKNLYSKEALKGIIEKDYDLNLTDGIFKEQLTYKYKKGVLKDTTFQFRTKGDFSQGFSSDGANYNQNLFNIGLNGNFRSEKERYNFLFDFIPHDDENFFHQLVLDAWVESHRIKNNTILLGTSRPSIGVEGGTSGYLVPFINRSQSARTIGSARKTGVRLIGDYKYFEYDLGGFSSDQKYHQIFSGTEGNIWVGIKPFANVKEKYGDLKLFGGIQAGEHNSRDYFTSSTALKYDNKKIWFLAEYQSADGSNGSDGMVRNRRDGYNLTLAYRINKKLEFLLRYDDFNYDKKHKSSSQKEYTAGVNYYLLGQGLRLILNYVYCDSEFKKNSHKLIFGTQFIL